MTKPLALLIAGCLIAAVTPLTRRPEPVTARSDSAQWPAEFERMNRSPLTASDQKYSSGFQGPVARFHEENKQYVVRRADSLTRSLHPPEHCYRAQGYQLSPLPMETTPSDNGKARRWSCFLAVKAGEAPIKVCQCIWDELGRVWSDVSAWFWAGALGQTKGPWWAVTRAESAGR